MKTCFRSLFVSLFIALAFLSPLPVGAQNTKEWDGGCVDVQADGSKVATLQGIECVVGNVLAIGVTGVAITAFVMLLIGSGLYLTSGGNPKTTDAGQKTITFALTGIVVAISGWVILNFIGTFTGTGDKINVFHIVLPKF